MVRRRRRKSRTTFSRRHPVATVTGCALAVFLMATACDFSVTNPGPVPDDFLDNPEARQAIVNGMARAFSEALNPIARVTGSVAREIFPSGNTGNFGITVKEGQGILSPDEADDFWDPAQNARWVAENGIERFKRAMEEAELTSSRIVAEAYVWAGYSNRLLGENFCKAVINGGSIQPATVFFERAEVQFTTALEIASNAGATQLAMAARAGRATVRMSLGNWTSAVSDATAIPQDFVFQAHYFSVSPEQYNSIAWSVANTPYRVHTVWNTPYLEYYEETQDPRTPWGEDTEYPLGGAARECCGEVIWKFQLKYAELGADIDLADGRAMDLIVAEALLREGDWQAAMQIINNLRATVGVDPWVASSLEEAWTRFKRERGIELWLEGRRMHDLRRWKESNTPGNLHPLERASNPDTYLTPNRDLCWPIPDSERETNPNIPSN